MEKALKSSPSLFLNTDFFFFFQSLAVATAQ